MGTIILNEWRILLRSKAILYITLIFIFSSIAVVWMGVLQSNNQKKIQSSAQQHIRSQWDNLEPMNCLLYTSPSPRDGLLSRMPSSA